MAGNTNGQYLESKILTASQPRLHLMLLELAGRQCRVALDAGTRDFWGEFDGALEKTMDIVEELVRSVTNQPHKISSELEEQYAFIFRELAVSRVNVDLEKLDSCLKLLEFERQTWKLACEKLETETTSRPIPVAPHFRSSATLASESFSFEA
jgi:flagellar secretion chaperone FliS